MTTINDSTSDFFCSQLSQESDELMAGTAVSAPVWILLEYRRAWRAKATSDNELPQSVKAWLGEQLGMVNGRLQFIRQTPSAHMLTCFVAVPDVARPRLYRFELENHRDLLDLDLPAVVAGDSRFDGRRTDGPLYLVCTNGKRDRCCALFGAALYREFAQEVGTAVWQTTHLGGHRFAPTLLSFPEGAAYGRFTTADIPRLTAAQQQGQLLPDRLRGRIVYDAPTQAADYFLRIETDRYNAGAFRHLDTQVQADEQWVVQFKSLESGHSFLVTVQTADPQAIYASCGSVAPKSVRPYKLRQIVVSD